MEVGSQNNKSTSDAIERIRRRALRRIAAACLAIDLTRTRATMQLRTRGDDIQVLPEHEKAIGLSIAGRQLSTLASLAMARGGTASVAHIVGIACDFFEANGTAYRLL